MFLGLCLPGSCDRASLTSMIRASADRVEREGNSTYRSSGPKIHIVTVKPVPSSNYCAWRDPKFYVLSWVIPKNPLTAGCRKLFVCTGRDWFESLGRTVGPPIWLPASRDNPISALKYKFAAVKSRPRCNLSDRTCVLHTWDTCSRVKSEIKK